MSRDPASLAVRHNGKYRTAAMLAAFALGLFMFTLYSGLK
jgi:hypothetical protein